jgi:hypothetical protein
MLRSRTPSRMSQLMALIRALVATLLLGGVVGCEIAPATANPSEWAVSRKGEVSEDAGPAVAE